MEARTGETLVKFFRSAWVIAVAIGIFLLPWGTRIILGESKLIPGEWGVFSFFVFEVFLWASVAVLDLYMVFRLIYDKNRPKSRDFSRFFILAIVLLNVYFFARSLFSIDTQVSFAWSVRALLASIFSLMIYFLSEKELNFWIKTFLISSVPVFALAIFQFFNQDIFASTILGIAQHHPWVSGTIVIESIGGRWLRSYAGFPHPNILGAYSVFVWMFAFIFIYKKTATQFWIITSHILAVVSIFIIVISFSRSSWAMLGIAFLVFLFFAFSKNYFKFYKKRILFFLSYSFVAIGFFGIIFSPLLISRFNTSLRLEAKSINERKTFDYIALKAIKQNFFFGTGAGTSSYIIYKNNDKILRVEAAPPHSVFLVFILEQGIVGFLFLVLAFLLWVAYIKKISQSYFLSLTPVVIILPILFLDHFSFTLAQGIFLTTFFIHAFVKALAVDKS